MTIACKITLNAITLYPELPIACKLTPVGAEIELQNGGTRFYHRKTIREWSMVIKDLDESTKNDWLAAGAMNASVTYTDEMSTSYTCRVTDLSCDLTRTTPAVNEGTNTTGPGFYDLSVTVRQIQ
jgi:hypothetical protein